MDRIISVLHYKRSILRRNYSKTCVKRPLKNRQNKDLKAPKEQSKLGPYCLQYSKHNEP